MAGGLGEIPPNAMASTSHSSACQTARRLSVPPAAPAKPAAATDVVSPLREKRHGRWLVFSSLNIGVLFAVIG